MIQVGVNQKCYLEFTFVTVTCHLLITYLHQQQAVPSWNSHSYVVKVLQLLGFQVVQVQRISSRAALKRIPTAKMSASGKPSSQAAIDLLMLMQKLKVFLAYLSS